MKLNAQQLSRLQLQINEWIEHNGGDFGEDLSCRAYEINRSVVTMNCVSLRMAEAAAAAYELAASIVNVPIN